MEIVEGAARLHVRIEVSHGIISTSPTSYITKKAKESNLHDFFPREQPLLHMIRALPEFLAEDYRISSVVESSSHKIIVSGGRIISFFPKVTVVGLRTLRILAQDHRRLSADPRQRSPS
jgi:hypothetical protein